MTTNPSKTALQVTRWQNYFKYILLFYALSVDSLQPYSSVLHNISCRKSASSKTRVSFKPKYFDSAWQYYIFRYKTEILHFNPPPRQCCFFKDTHLLELLTAPWRKKNGKKTKQNKPLQIKSAEWEKLILCFVSSTHFVTIQRSFRSSAGLSGITAGSPGGRAASASSVGSPSEPNPERAAHPSAIGRPRPTLRTRPRTRACRQSGTARRTRNGFEQLGRRAGFRAVSLFKTVNNNLPEISSKDNAIIMFPQ